jgi:hypothetical protein
MAKNAAIGNLNLASVGLSEKAINLLVDLAHRYGSERGQDWMAKTTEMVATGLTPLAQAAKTELNLITRTAPVNRTRTPKEAMVAMGCVPYLNETVLASLPLGTGDTVTMSFYRFGRYIASDKLDKELAKVGLELDVDPIGQAAINEADKGFAETHPNGTQWKNADGKTCYAIFIRWDGERRVNVGQGDGGWGDFWWFPVRCK